MPRDGSGNYTLPFPDVVTNTTIASTVYNGFEHDIATDLNTPRPIVAGGTGASSAAAALAALQGETFGQVVTNYDSHVFLPGSFYSAGSATSPPVVGHAFVGNCAFVDANNIYLQAFDRDDTSQPGAVWIRQKKAGVWSSWAKAQALNIVGTPVANQFTTWQSSTALQGVGITGLVKGNGASAPSAAVAGTDYSTVAVANPGSQKVGLTAVNGSAATAMRSDGAPALDVAISPTWTGTHAFSIGPTVPTATAGTNTTQAASTAFVQAATAAVVRTVKIQSFTASGTYTPSAGMVYCIIECVGGGAGGGGAAAAAGSSGNGAGGGSAGTYSRKIVAAATVGASQTVTIGAGGSGGSAGANNGSVGNTTSVGSICTAPGGNFGTGAASGSNGAGGNASSTGTGDISVPGGAGQSGAFMTTSGFPLNVHWAGSGGDSMYGRGGKSQLGGVAGNPGSGYGAGGAGAGGYNASAALAGGNGTTGIAVITEFCSQ